MRNEINLSFFTLKDQANRERNNMRRVKLYSQVVTILVLAFENTSLCPKNVLVCFVSILE